jgi:bifunctional non-homologous end joining protein LigD
MLATTVAEPFRKDGWLFEIKWDGYRAIAEVVGSNVRIQSRNGNNLSGRFPSIVRQLGQLGHQAVLDGEIVVLDSAGVARFEWLQNFPSYGGQLVYYVFDVLHLDGRDLTGLPLRRRKELLKQIIPSASPQLRYCDHIDTEGKSFFEAIKRGGAEGMIAKDGASQYLPGRRSKRWLKIKHHSRQEAVIAGYKQGEGARQELGSLVLGVFRHGTLVHIGEVGTGLTDPALRSLLQRLNPLVQETCPFQKRPKIVGRVHWVRPILRCDVKFQSWTVDGRLRHPVWLGLREGTQAETKPAESQQPAKPLRRTTETALVEGHTLTLSNLGKVFWPKDQITKRELVAYYRDVAPLLLPYLRDRPLSLHRYPDGVEGQSFFQKDLRKAPDWVRTIAIRHDSREKPINYVLCQDEATLAYLANLAAMELHPWHSRTSALDRPDYIVIDLDPRDTPFSRVIDVALAVRTVLDKAGAACWCKTSGMTGLHVYVPLAQRYDYTEAAQFADLVARIVHQRLPQATSLDRDPARRRTLVYLDSLQNRRGQSIAAVYAVRANPEAMISTPLKWSEVKRNLDPTAFTLRTVPKRLSKLGDIWTGVLGNGIDMLECLNRLPGLVQFPARPARAD